MTKKMMVDFFFPFNYNEIIFYISNSLISTPIHPLKKNENTHSTRKDKMCGTNIEKKKSHTESLLDACASITQVKPSRSCKGNCVPNIITQSFNNSRSSFENFKC